MTDGPVGLLVYIGPAVALAAVSGLILLLRYLVSKRK